MSFDKKDMLRTAIWSTVIWGIAVSAILLLLLLIEATTVESASISKIFAQILINTVIVD